MRRPVLSRTTTRWRAACRRSPRRSSPSSAGASKRRCATAPVARDAGCSTRRESTSVFEVQECAFDAAKLRARDERASSRRRASKSRCRRKQRVSSPALAALALALLLDGPPGRSDGRRRSSSSTAPTRASTGCSPIRTRRPFRPSTSSPRWRSSSRRRSLTGAAVTVMDGPFFSMMPYPSRGTVHAEPRSLHASLQLARRARRAAHRRAVPARESRDVASSTWCATPRDICRSMRHCRDTSTHSGK